MKIAYILSRFPKLSETFILREIVELKKNNFEIEIFSLKNFKKNELIHKEAENFLNNTNYSPYFLSKKLISANIYFLYKSPLEYLRLISYIIKHNYKSISSLIKSFIIFPKSLYFAKIIMNKKIEHIHAHWATFPTLTAVIINKLTIIPFSFTAHANDIFTDLQNIKTYSNNAKKVITISNYNKKYMIDRFGINKDKIEVIHCGVNLYKFKPIKSNKCNKLNILSIARLTEKKGIKYLIEACKILEGKRINFECVILGEGPRKKNLQKLINIYKLNKNVKLIGHATQEEILKEFKKCNIFILPCIEARNGDRDGIPVSLMEAMALGVPAISTHISGIPELIKNEFNGILIPPKNSKTLSEAIIKLKNDLYLFKKISKNSPIIIKKHFNIKKNIKKLIKIFTENA